jgi:hypothetical protein
MQKWKIITYSGVMGYIKNSMIYNYAAEMMWYENHFRDINEIHNWITNNNIDVVESNKDFIWYFKNEEDRTYLLLTWS